MQSPQDFQLELTDESNKHVIGNLYPGYLHDIAAYDPRSPNAHGVLADADDVRSWDDVLECQRAWWRNPELLFPYLARVGGRPAGFSLVASGGYVPTEGVDFVIYEFFIAQAFRRTGTGIRTAQESIAKHRGQWEVVTYPTNDPAIAFWRKALAPCATSGVVETREEHPWGPKVVWRFSV